MYIRYLAECSNLPFDFFGAEAMLKSELVVKEIV